MKPTIENIAAAAGVSTATVSRALRDDPTVTKETRERVKAIAEKSGYQPLRKRRAKARPLDGKTVAMVLLGMDKSLTTLPVIAGAIHGVEAALAQAGARLLLADYPTLRELPAVLLKSRLTGVILKGALQGEAIGAGRDDLLQFLRGLPSVWVLGRPRNAWGDSVAADNFLAGQMAAQHLLSYGHRQLAFLNPKSDHVTFQARQWGFEQAAREGGATVHEFIGAHPEEWTLPLHPVEKREAVRDLMSALLSHPARPSAVFAPADSIAALLYRDLWERGLQPGRDLSIISCNNETPVIAALHPALTTFDVHAEMMGSRAVAQLVWRLGEADAEAPMDITLSPTLVNGASVLPKK